MRYRRNVQSRIERKTTCNRDCPDACGIVATIENERVVALRGDRQHPVTRGTLCYRTQRFLHLQNSPARLTSPLLRKHGELSEVTWDEALDFIAAELTRVKREWGPAAIVHYRSGGSLGMLKTLTDYFFSLFGPVTIKRGDICSGAGEAAQMLDFGLSDSSDLFTLLESKHIIVWGKNLVTSSPHTLRVVHDARKRGARVILIDPIRHAGVKHADSFVQPRPGSDFVLAMAVARACFERGYVVPDAASFCENLAEFRALAFARSIEDACREADVDAAAVQALARALHEGPSAILVGWGMGRRSNGGAIVRALDALGAITGNLGIPGGGVSFYFRRRGAFDLSFAQINPAPRSVREPCLAHDIAALRDPPARALWVTCGNPVAMLPDSANTARVMRELPLTVVADSFLTDTARLATVVLPTPTLLEADDILGSYGHHYLSVARPVVAAPSGVKSDLEIVQALADRVGLGDALAGTAQQWQERLVAKRLGAHGVTLADLERGAIHNPMANPVLFADRKFFTPSGKVELVTAEPPPSAAKAGEAYPLTLLALSTPEAQCSQWSVEPPLPPPLTLHPAAAIGFQDGETCAIESRLGRMRVTLHFDTGQRRDVALLAKGGSYEAGASANALIHARTTDLGEGAAFYEETVRLVPLNRR